VPWFECTVFPVPVADPGSYTLDCTATAALETEGDLAAFCQPGVLQLLENDLSNETPVPTPTALRTPVRGSPTPTGALRATISPSTSNEDDGCQVGAPSGAGSFVGLLGPALLLILAWRRRRISRRA